MAAAKSKAAKSFAATKQNLYVKVQPDVFALSHFCENFLRK
jgi:hypothetical protein